MNLIKELREKRHLSQRKFAKKAGISFRTLQMAESNRGNPRFSTLNKISEALGRPSGELTKAIEDIWNRDVDSIWSISEKITTRGEDSWKQFLFEFVDAFRNQASESLIETPPVPKTGPRIRALLTSTVEMLCHELNLDVPWWTAGVGTLPEPWFVSAVENLKASALIESPVWYRKRQIFVLDNFLERI